MLKKSLTEQQQTETKNKREMLFLNPKGEHGTGFV